MQKKSIKQIHQKLHHWYAQYGRHDLPWRHTEDPYHIYISEIMLQQTQVKTVLERYYFPFLEQFPSLTALANAPLDEVLKAWEGLGYYTRAKNLHHCANAAKPTLPTTFDSLVQLPGIGENTASAICAFAYKQPLAVMEANVKRILSRIFALKTPQKVQLQQLANQLLDKENPYDYNQAIMDIGSMVCTVKSPDCAVCPYASICLAREQNDFDYPEKKKKTVPTREDIIMIESQDNAVYMRQREGKFLHGLWGFESMKEGYEEMTYLGTVTQSYTHFTYKAKVYHDNAPKQKDRFFTKKEIAQLALSGVDKKVIKLLEKNKIL